MSPTAIVDPEIVEYPRVDISIRVDCAGEKFVSFTVGIRDLAKEDTCNDHDEDLGR